MPPPAPAQLHNEANQWPGWARSAINLETTQSLWSPMRAKNSQLWPASCERNTVAVVVPSSTTPAWAGSAASARTEPPGGVVHVGADGVAAAAAAAAAASISPAIARRRNMSAETIDSRTEASVSMG